MATVIKTHFVSLICHIYFCMLCFLNLSLFSCRIHTKLFQVSETILFHTDMISWITRFLYVESMFVFSSWISICCKELYALKIQYVWWCTGIMWAENALDIMFLILYSWDGFICIMMGFVYNFIFVDLHNLYYFF